MSIAVLMACHNRKETTLRCLDALALASENVVCDIYLVDDGSADGTGDAVRAWGRRVCSDGITVRVIPADGTLYWARGMSLAWQEAVASGEKYTHFLWLNDDAVLYADALELLMKSDDGRSLVVGNLCDEQGKDVYGLNVNGWVNGNCILVPYAVYEKVGLICGGYHHAMADGDYALMVVRAGLRVTGAGCVGTTTWHPNRPSLKGLSLIERGRMLRDPKGWNLHDLYLYRLRNGGRLAALASSLHFLLHVFTSRE